MAKRFYKVVTVAPIEGADTDAYGVFLDGRALKTQGKQALVLQRLTHAESVAREWDAQAEDILPHTMPCTRLVNVAIEQTPTHRERVIAEGCNYVRTDVLCYRAENPSALNRRQAELWDPVLDWARGQGVELKTTSGIIAIEQDESSIEAVQAYLSGLNHLELTLCVHFIAVYGSAVLGLAVMQKHLTAQAAFELSRLDVLWQIEHWGVDEDAQKISKSLQAEITALSPLI